MARSVAQVLDHLSIKSKVLSLNPSITKQKQKPKWSSKKYIIGMLLILIHIS
jgi:hypothetical protein